jgi:pyruvate/2-oxoglutarate/acetoin dehydrogenase E1 component
VLGTNLVLYRELCKDEATLVFSTHNSPRFIKEFGTRRIRTFPIAEESMTAMAVGAAMCGLRPIVELHRSSFLFAAMDPIVNQAAKLEFMSGGQVSINLTVRVATRWRDHLGSQHEQVPYSVFLNVPGFCILAPGTAEDAPRAFMTAFQFKGPALFFEAPTTWRQWPDDSVFEPLPLGSARIVRVGNAATIVGIGGAVETALEAAAALDGDGLPCTVIDPVTLVPLDMSTICTSAAQTGRLIVVDEAPIFASISAEIAARVESDAITRANLQHPVVRIGALRIPVPFSATLEREVFPTASAIVRAVRTLHES